MAMQIQGYKNNMGLDGESISIENRIQALKQLLFRLKKKPVLTREEERKKRQLEKQIAELEQRLQIIRSQEIKEKRQKAQEYESFQEQCQRFKKRGKRLWADRSK